MIKRYVIYGFMGWCAEIIWTGCLSLFKGDFNLVAHTSIWMFFIYGFALFLEPLHHKIKNWRWIFRGLIWVMVIWTIEYICGYILKLTVGTCPWRYTDILSINGFITLFYGPVWFVAGFLFEIIHGFIDNFNVIYLKRIKEN